MRYLNLFAIFFILVSLNSVHSAKRMGPGKFISKAQAKHGPGIDSVFKQLDTLSDTKDYSPWSRGWLDVMTLVLKRMQRGEAQGLVRFVGKSLTRQSLNHKNFQQTQGKSVSVGGVWLSQFVSKVVALETQNMTFEGKISHIDQLKSRLPILRINSSQGKEILMGEMMHQLNESTAKSGLTDPSKRMRQRFVVEKAVHNLDAPIEGEQTFKNPKPSTPTHSFELYLDPKNLPEAIRSLLGDIHNAEDGAEMTRYLDSVLLERMNQSSGQLTLTPKETKAIEKAISTVIDIETRTMTIERTITHLQLFKTRLPFSVEQNGLHPRILARELQRQVERKSTHLRQANPLEQRLNQDRLKPAMLELDPPQDKPQSKLKSKSKKEIGSKISMLRAGFYQSDTDGLFDDGTENHKGRMKQSMDNALNTLEERAWQVPYPRNQNKLAPSQNSQDKESSKFTGKHQERLWSKIESQIQENETAPKARITGYDALVQAVARVGTTFNLSASAKSRLLQDLVPPTPSSRVKFADFSKRLREVPELTQNQRARLEIFLSESQEGKYLNKTRMAHTLLTLANVEVAFLGYEKMGLNTLYESPVKPVRIVTVLGKRASSHIARSMHTVFTVAAMHMFTEVYYTGKTDPKDAVLSLLDAPEFWVSMQASSIGALIVPKKFTRLSNISPGMEKFAGVLQPMVQNLAVLVTWDIATAYATRAMEGLTKDGKPLTMTKIFDDNRLLKRYLKNLFSVVADPQTAVDIFPHLFEYRWLSAEFGTMLVGMTAGSRIGASLGSGAIVAGPQAGAIGRGLGGFIGAVGGAVGASIPGRKLDIWLMRRGIKEKREALRKDLLSPSSGVFATDYKKARHGLALLQDYEDYREQLVSLLSSFYLRDLSNLAEMENSGDEDQANIDSEKKEAMRKKAEILDLFNKDKEMFQNILNRKNISEPLRDLVITLENEVVLGAGVVEAQFLQVEASQPARSQPLENNNQDAKGNPDFLHLKLAF
jgi:hypothetical protein